MVHGAVFDEIVHLAVAGDQFLAVLVHDEDDVVRGHLGLLRFDLLEDLAEESDARLLANVEALVAHG